MKFEHNNISPLDNRYSNKISEHREAFSEKSLIKTIGNSQNQSNHNNPFP